MSGPYIRRVAPLLALLSSLLWGTADFAGGLASRRLPAVAVVAWGQAAAFVVLLGLAATTSAGPGGAGWHGWSGWGWWSVLAGATGAAALVCFYLALASGTMGVVSPIASLGAVIPLVAGVLAGEQPQPVQWAGMALALAGAVGASGPELSGAVGRRSVVLAVLAGIGFGVALLGIARGSADNATMTLVGMRATSVVGFAAAGLALRTTGGVRARDLPLLAGIGLADGAANLLYGLAARGELLTVVSVLGALYPVATVLLARFALNERMRPVQAFGVAGALAGVSLIAVG
jgi:drug/metabolite transporter (DMT)-like permease